MPRKAKKKWTVKSAWKLKTLVNEPKMAKMCSARDSGASWAKLEKLFGLPKRHGCNARELILSWRGRREGAATMDEPRAVHVAPRPKPEKISLPRGVRTGTQEAKEAVAHIRAIALRVRPNDLTPGRIADLYADAVQRGMVRGVKPAVVSREEIEHEDNLRLAKYNSNRARRLERAWASCK